MREMQEAATGSLEGVGVLKRGEDVKNDNDAKDGENTKPHENRVKL